MRLGAEYASGYGFAVLLFALACGCGRYADFTLPPPRSGGPQPPFAWQPSARPVLGRGDPAQWDSVDVLNPSVVRFQGRYLNLYSGFDGRAWHTGAATSSDGVHWSKQGRIVSPSGWEGSYIAANGSALVQGQEILYWYQAGDPPRIALAQLHRWRSHGGRRAGPRAPPRDRAEAVMSAAWPIRPGCGPDTGSICSMWARTGRGGSGWGSRDHAMASSGRSCDPILFSNWANPPALSKREWAGRSRPCGPPRAPTVDALHAGATIRMTPPNIGLAEIPGRRPTGQRDAGFRSPLAGSEPWDSSVLCDPTLEVMDHGRFASGSAAATFRTRMKISTGRLAWAF